MRLCHFSHENSWQPFARDAHGLLQHQQRVHRSAPTRPPATGLALLPLTNSHSVPEAITAVSTATAAQTDTTAQATDTTLPHQVAA